MYKKSRFSKIGFRTYLFQASDEYNYYVVTINNIDVSYRNRVIVPILYWKYFIRNRYFME